MVDDIKILFNDGLQYTHTAGILQGIANLLNIVNPQFLKDQEGKNKMIDLVCDILKSHKDKPVEQTASCQNPGGCCAPN